MSDNGFDLSPNLIGREASFPATRPLHLNWLGGLPGTTINPSTQNTIASSHFNEKRGGEVAEGLPLMRLFCCLKAGLSVMG